MGKVAVSRMPCFPDHSFFSDTRVTNWHFVHYIKRKSEPNSRGSTQDYLFRPAFKHRGCPKNLGSIHTWLKQLWDLQAIRSPSKRHMSSGQMHLPDRFDVTHITS